MLLKNASFNLPAVGRFGVKAAMYQSELLPIACPVILLIVEMTVTEARQRIEVLKAWQKLRT